MSSKRVFTAGDSYATGIHGTEGYCKDGWPDLLGLLPENRFAAPGAVSLDWCDTQPDSYLRQIASSLCPHSIVIMSIGGNDALAAMADGKLGASEAYFMVVNIMKAISLMSARCENLIVMTYPDPYRGKRKAISSGLIMLNAVIRAAAGTHANTSILSLDEMMWERKDFSPPDIHPAVSGHKKIALAVAAKVESLGVKLGEVDGPSLAG